MKLTFILKSSNISTYEDETAIRTGRCPRRLLTELLPVCDIDKPEKSNQSVIRNKSIKGRYPLLATLLFARPLTDVAYGREYNMTEEILLTKEGYENIVIELEELIAVKRTEVAERIKEAISYGDISENAEYDSAKNEQAELEKRIDKLENMIRKAKIIDGDEVSKDKVGLGLTVKVKDGASGEISEFTIVGSTEADPFEGKISNESLVGSALIGRKVDDKVEIQVPDGLVIYDILDIYRK